MMEWCSRCNTIKIVGIPEGEEKSLCLTRVQQRENSTSYCPQNCRLSAPPSAVTSTKQCVECTWTLGEKIHSTGGKENKKKKPESADNEQIKRKKKALKESAAKAIKLKISSLLVWLWFLCRPENLLPQRVVQSCCDSSVNTYTLHSLN